MANIEFSCPNCGQSLIIDSRGAGMSVNCAECMKQLIVPSVDYVEDSNSSPRIREKPKLKLKRDAHPSQYLSTRHPVSPEPMALRRSAVPRIEFRLYTSSIIVAFIIAFLIAVAGNLAWLWLASHIGEGAEWFGEIGGLLILAAPIYAAIKMLRTGGFVIGILCALTYFGGTIAGDAIFINFMDSSIHRNLNRNREVLADDYAILLASQLAESEGWAIDNEEQWGVLLAQILPEAQKALPTMPQAEFDVLVDYSISAFREWPLKDQIISMNSDENALWIILGVCAAFGIGFKGSKDT